MEKLKYYKKKGELQLNKFSEIIKQFGNIFRKYFRSYNTYISWKIYFRKAMYFWRLYYI